MKNIAVRPNILIKFILIFCFIIPFYEAFGIEPSTPNPSDTSPSLKWTSNSVKLSFTEMLDMFLIEQGLKQNLSISTLREAFNDVSYQTTAKQYITPASGPKAKKNWLRYRQNTMNPIRIKAGKKFWLEHQKYLMDLEQSTGIPSAIVVGILGVETIYGQNMGNFPVRDVLATLAFDYPNSPNKVERSQMFSEQLADLIQYCARVSADDQGDQFKTCLVQPGSFAGAIGMPQFMPSSIVKYAKDGDMDSKIDLRNNSFDAMASIANFMLQHGWVIGQPILLPINKEPEVLDKIQKIADGDPHPKWTLDQLKAQKIIQNIPQSMSPQDLALIVDLPLIDAKGKESIQYWVGLKNFEVITQYNRSFFYAMAVTEFGYSVANLVDPHQTNPLQVPIGDEIKQEKPRSTNNDRRDRKQQKR